jgi:hypothetical protein
VKNKFLTALISLCVPFTANAQTAETISKLTPVSSNIGKFTKNVPKIRDSVLGKSYEIKFNVKTEPVNSPSEEKAVAVLIRIDPRELVFENVGGIETATVKFYGRVTSRDEKTDGFFEEILSASATIEELSDVSKLKPVTLRKVFTLTAGKYQIGIIVRDLRTGARRKDHKISNPLKLELPQPFLKVPAQTLFDGTFVKSRKFSCRICRRNRAKRRENKNQAVSESRIFCKSSSVNV